MPLFVTPRGEGVYVAPAAPRRKLTQKQIEAIRYEKWLRLRDAGLTIREICAVFEKPFSTIREGLAIGRSNRALRQAAAQAQDADDAEQERLERRTKATEGMGAIPGIVNGMTVYGTCPPRGNLD